MWGVDELQVHEICCRRPVYREEVEPWSNYKKPYLRWFRNIACGYVSTGSTRIEKDQVRVPPGLVWGKGEEWMVWFNVCGAPLDDWATGGSVDVFFTYGMVSVLWIVGPILGNGYEV